MSLRLETVARTTAKGRFGVAELFKSPQILQCGLHPPSTAPRYINYSSVHVLKRQRLSAVFASPDHAPPVVNDIIDFKWEESTNDGRLIITPLDAVEVGAASVVLTRAFATSPQGVPIEDGR